MTVGQDGGGSNTGHRIASPSIKLSLKGRMARHDQWLRFQPSRLPWHERKARAIVGRPRHRAEIAAARAGIEPQHDNTAKMLGQPFHRDARLLDAGRGQGGRVHALEEQARPETVLYHKKQVELYAERVSEADSRFTALTEIFRLDLRRWLAHTDDPKREIVFADPVRGRVDRAEAPRVYNIGVVYRLRRESDAKAPWHRARVVVTRKGIRRIDPIA